MTETQIQPRVARGVAVMTAASLLVSLVDGTAKLLSESHSVLVVAWARFSVAFLFVLPVALWKFGLRCWPRRHLRAHVMRTCFLVGAMTLFFASLQTTALADAIVAFFVAPSVALLLAVILLGERATVMACASLVLGMTGVSIAVQPTATPTLGILMALAAGVLMGFYLVATRVAGNTSHPLRTLVFQCGFGALLLAPFALPHLVVPNLTDAGLFAVLGGVSAGVHLMVIRAFQLAPTATLAPLIYLELVGAAAVGYLFFGDIPNTPTMVGAGLIAISGLLAWRAAAV